ncbi:CHAD domain-containing protein [Streptomyces sp. CA-111067]|uniref:CYTH and CHAD domain-containing protein n=1 Tax=Streptomyces sp. CA-111067 TaxID=3240046 RepID=UPI003D97B4D9
MVRALTETERKYEADESAADVAAAPLDLEGLPSVATVTRLEPVLLDAVYFDTAELALAAHRTTLRRRTGGTDAGWHLKRPTDRADTRTELHASLGRAPGRPPKALRAEVAALTRGRELAPVVRLRTTRRLTLLLDAEGRTLAEVAYDEVRADLVPPGETAGSTWTETEVELHAGGDALLDAVEERLGAAGLHRSASASKLARALGDRLTPPPAPPAVPRTAGETAAGYLHAQLAAILALDPAVRRADEDAVHRMRVATRRARSAFRSFDRQLSRAYTDPLGAELKWLAEVLGAERDREVLAERLTQRLAELDPGTAPPPRLREATEQGGGTHDAVVAVLDGARYFALLDDLEALLAAPPYLLGAGADAESAVAVVVGRDHRRLRRRIDTALDLPPGEDRDVGLHEARKAAKRARYSAEAAEPVLGVRARAQTGRMKAVQHLLGEHQDSVMCRAAVTALRAEAVAAGEDPAPYDAIARAERERAARVEARLPEAWAAADQPV